MPQATQPRLAQWRASLSDPDLRAGARDMMGMSIGVAAWGLVTGVAMIKGGMGVWMSLLMSLLVYAGSAQLAVMPMLTAGAPLWVIWFTAACVNVRFIIFSAVWRAHFGHFSRFKRCLLGYLSGDVTYIMFSQRYPDGKPGRGQIPYFLGASLLNWSAWHISSIAGIFLANVLPVQWGLGFAGVLALMGVLCSMLVDRATWLALGVAASAALAAYALPLRLNILVAIAAAMVIGLIIEATDKALRNTPVTIDEVPHE
ncbi:Predicted branched-chain amino acid permease (azaleucine resistance) [Polaromonas sp. OV174]|uniref:AzlC family ABC transporter permease n=1 Tax=Polaromonas sp. OV174 TaxID=1855300 RepID=UPI0008E2B92A|nr:Predicted branched-chain amino acid permease (azaleucine resistance) [Polaromonas sp. OV174]